MPRFDQHFLVKTDIVQEIIKAGNFTKDDFVLEIGPGKGILTEKIIPIVKKIFAVEIDTYLSSFLKQKFLASSNLEIFTLDFLNFDLNSIPLPEGKKLKIIGNIPYSITTPILEKIFCYPRWDVAIIMMQKEVANRILSSCGKKSFSRLTLWTNFYSIPHPIIEVKKDCFRPVPKVDSFVVKFFPNYKYSNFKLKEKMFRVIELSFAQRRKTILNSLSSGLKMDKKILQDYLKKAGISPGCRAENVDLEGFMKITEILSK